MNLFDLYAKITLDTGDYDANVKDAVSEGEGLASKLAKAGQAASRGISIIGTASTAVVGGLLALESSTEEYRAAQGRLNTAFEAAGMSADAAQQAYSAFYGILGDTDTATEASQLLAKLAQSEEDVATWTNIAAGVSGTFGDSLPIESLIEAANETAKVGTVTGTLADALNWAGISEDAFNEKLEACSTESERNRIIMDTLSGTYDDAADAFYRNNEELVKSRENQSQLNDSLSKIGQSVSTVKNAFVEQFTPVIESASEHIAEFISGIDTEKVVSGLKNLVDTFVDLSPVIAAATSAVIAYKAASAISGVIDALKTATQGQTIAQAALNAVMNANPFVLIATLIAGLVTALVTLWNTNEGFREAVTNIWEGIKSVFVSAWEGIKTVWDTVADFFSNIWDQIQKIFEPVTSFFSNVFGMAWEGIKVYWDAVVGYFSQIWETIKGIFSVVKDVLSGNFSDAWEGIKEIVSGWVEYFSGVWDGIKNVFSNVWSYFEDIGKKIINGIKSGIKSAWDGLVSWFNGLWDSLFGGRSVDVEVNKSEKEPDGSHAGGLSYVPFNGYLAELHRGEMVLTANQAKNYRQGQISQTVVNQYIQAVPMTPAELARQSRDAFDRLRWT